MGRGFAQLRLERGDEVVVVVGLVYESLHLQLELPALLLHRGSAGGGAVRALFGSGQLVPRGLQLSLERGDVDVGGGARWEFGRVYPGG